MIAPIGISTQRLGSAKNHVPLPHLIYRTVRLLLVAGTRSLPAASPSLVLAGVLAAVDDVPSRRVGRPAARRRRHCIIHPRGALRRLASCDDDDDGGEAGVPSLLRHVVGRHRLGRLHRRHHHVLVRTRMAGSSSARCSDY